MLFFWKESILPSLDLYRGLASAYPEAEKFFVLFFELSRGEVLYSKRKAAVFDCQRSY
jgi:hypothetical protein